MDRNVPYFCLFGKLGVKVTTLLEIEVSEITNGQYSFSSLVKNNVSPLAKMNFCGILKISVENFHSKYV